MKRILCYIFLLLIFVLLTGCEGATLPQETSKDDIAFSDVTAPPDVSISAMIPDITETPEITPSALVPDAKATPEITPVPTPNVFSVDDVIMQPTPGSSCFDEIGYDPDWEILVVRFRDSGSVYTYLDFPLDEWNKFISADSLGSWYNKHIKGKYEDDRIS